MAGFTPINAPVPKTTSIGSAGDITAKKKRPRIGRASAIPALPKYPDHGAPEPSASCLGQTAPPMKPAAKGKKRAASVKTAPKSKRRKSSNVSDGMRIVKPSAGAHIEDSSGAAAKRNVEQKTVSDPKCESDTTAAVPVFEQMTYVKSVQATKPITSLDAVRGRKGFGQTIYSKDASGQLGPGDSDQTQESRQRNVEFTHPLLSTATDSHSKTATPEHVSDQASLWSFPLDPFCQEGEDDDEEMDTLVASLEAPVPASLQPTRVKAMNQQLPTPVTSDAPTQPPKAQRKIKKLTKEVPQIQTDEDFFISDDSDESAATEVADVVEASIRPLDVPAPTRSAKDNIREVDRYEDYGGALFSEEERRVLNELKAASQLAAHKPVVRKPFPAPILDRSPILGASNIIALRTCFRIGEALNVGCHAARTNKDILLELYARIGQSWRDDKKQHFVLKDLYHDKPPHINGDFTLFSQSKLWDADSQVFLSAAEQSEGVMCRAMARMRRDGMKWKLEVLNIWEASWDDVEYAAGVYARDDKASWLTSGNN